MQSKMTGTGLRCLWVNPCSLLPWVPLRNASLNSAIGRGIRKSHAADRARPSARDSEAGRRSPRKESKYQPPARSRQPHALPDRVPNRVANRTPNRVAEFDEDEFIRTGNFRDLPREHRATRQPRFQQGASKPSGAAEPHQKPPKKGKKPRAHRATDAMPERVKEHVQVPTGIPYTTPASEFIYGSGAVEAALRCSRRQLYKLYLYQAAEEELSPTKIMLRKLALSKNIATKLAFAEWDRLMDKMSAGRPHNGCILEASPLPRLPVQALHPVPSITESEFGVELAPQTREEAAVNGTDHSIPILHPASLPGVEKQRHRHPVALLLDGIVDPGNLGAIIRSAYFLGIDAIVFAGRNSAPLSPVTIKSSAGAAENMALLYARNEVDFIQRSKSNGWRFYAADAPSPGAEYLDRISAEGESSDTRLLPYTQSPCVLMMGSEGSGLSAHIKSHANAIVSIPGARHGLGLGVEADPARIDSLNVSVAAALLMEMFLRTPLAVSDPVKKEKTTPKPKHEMVW